jgi:hypothetical protein
VKITEVAQKMGYWASPSSLPHLITRTPEPIPTFDYLNLHLLNLRYIGPIYVSRLTDLRRPGTPARMPVRHSTVTCVYLAVLNAVRQSLVELYVDGKLIAGLKYSRTKCCRTKCKQVYKVQL